MLVGVWEYPVVPCFNHIPRACSLICHLAAALPVGYPVQQVSCCNAGKQAPMP